MTWIADFFVDLVFQRRRRDSTNSYIHTKQATSGLSDEIIANDDQKLAYDEITKKVAEIIHDNPDAKVFITGHSLGGALATLYGAMLFYNAEHEITDKLAAIYTFGQPRVGDKEFAKYGETHLKDHYFRVVYCNDIVPRVPFDNEIFEYKHIGECSYYDSVYNGQVSTNKFLAFSLLNSSLSWGILLYFFTSSFAAISFLFQRSLLVEKEMWFASLTYSNFCLFL